ncbi:hypothetical protein VUJ46_18605 [Chryseobacterium sp. MYb264]|uniref:hypothetical protein n=1 Tax=Chryseobacterium sp. MYb264 TaxID=2745153 RepID=UPI002E13BAC4|nr:hypothetical protein VUJ46_18605 [Chryseobacterium sp. MYb264]
MRLHSFSQKYFEKNYTTADGNEADNETLYLADDSDHLEYLSSPVYSLDRISIFILPGNKADVIIGHHRSGSDLKLYDLFCEWRSNCFS